LFFEGGVVDVVSGGEAEGVGVVGVAFIEVGASGCRVSNDCRTVCCPVGANLEGLGREAGAGHLAAQRGSTMFQKTSKSSVA